MAVRSDRMYN